MNGIVSALQFRPIVAWRPSQIMEERSGGKWKFLFPSAVYTRQPSQPQVAMHAGAGAEIMQTVGWHFDRSVPPDAAWPQ